MSSPARSFITLCILVILVVSPLETRASPLRLRTTPPELSPSQPYGSGPHEAAPHEVGATFHITWQESCETPPAGAETALEYAASIWGGLIFSTVVIEVTACWASVLNCDGDALACGGPTEYIRNFTGAPLVDTEYPVALANALSSVDLDPSRGDMTVQFLAGADWSFETTTPSPTGTDLVSVALHEMAHGLGFSGNMYESYSVGFCGTGIWAYLYPCPTPYDRFAVDSQSIPLLSYLAPDPRDLGTRLKSDASFGGPNTIIANGGVAAKLYTPAIWQHGTSLSHLDPATFPGGDDGLMTPSYSDAVRHPGSVTLAVFQDMGWLRADGAPNLIVSSSPVVGVGNEAVFRAELAWTGYAGQAITYTWTASDGRVITHTLSSITDSAVLSWTVPGFKTVAATAVVSGVSASATRELLVIEGLVLDAFTYLPLVERQ